VRSELLIGCGRDRTKRLWVNGLTTWEGLVTLDAVADHKPDLVHDLEKLPLPFADDSFDEIHAYEVLEHTGQQGDWRFFFDQWSDFWRILKPGGLVLATTPGLQSPWLWGDPSHKRALPVECLTFLSQESYRLYVGKSEMSDFRFYYRADFATVWSDANGRSNRFIVKAIKPSTWAPPG
jgi:SAM-dependent methyltransferase